MDCPICLERLKAAAFSLTCGHLFHRGCVEAVIYAALVWNARVVVCPTCRAPSTPDFSPTGIRKIFVGDESEGAIAAESKTLQDLRRQLREAETKIATQSRLLDLQAQKLREKEDELRWFTEPFNEDRSSSLPVGDGADLNALVELAETLEEDGTLDLYIGQIHV
ncbi:hypothetical protein HYPSUDRAFT_41002 [Hypholoma sublateritium FD-334 SS-4]|uniref:RING-type domain-containing protein n=1 Tax=Hypholoma sublateritium (strain FD-334 SS-4) TaxID=945553 RepID=A0A0D2PR64_HYPSF|nr:hypothetical protein HYPSUDRAFT_41002 [Hypholoma sublateritium FD-334 SS-4]